MAEVPTPHEHGFNQLIEEALLRPVPNMDGPRDRKLGYSNLPIDTEHPMFDEPLAGLNEYGIAGQTYYSRPNASAGEPIEDVKPDPYLRKSVAETLARINDSLAHPAITAFFDGEVELWVEDALRPVSLQQRLYNEIFPRLIREQNPGISDEEMQERRKNLIAVPSLDPAKPSPHATGGAVDVSLRFKRDNLLYVPNSGVEFGHSDGDTSVRANPDYYEQHEPQNETDRIAQHNRRAFYAIMTGEAFATDTGLINNPTEWWHWGRGDQLSAKVHGDAAAYYSAVELDS